jgi:hypothetical protein
VNLIEGIQEQTRRVRDELIPMYESIGPAGAFAIAMMRAALKEGEAAIASNDVVRMVRACKSLEEFHE